MIEVATAQGRIAYGPVAAGDVEPLFDAGLLDGGPHPLRLGRPEEIPFLKRQTRLTFARCGIVDRLSLDDYRAHGGLRGPGARDVLGPGGDRRGSHQIRACAAAAAPAFRPASNGGRLREPGAAEIHRLQRRRRRFRHLRRPHDHGRRSVRADRRHGDRRASPSARPRATSISAPNIRTRSRSSAAPSRSRGAEAMPRRRHSRLAHDFDLEIRVGAGAYVCGEETALLDSLEGKRGLVRAKPPLPAHKGLFGQPTVVNNVISLASVPAILAGRRRRLSRSRLRPLARHDADPARRQRQASRPVRSGVRPHPGRDRRRYRRRYGDAAGRCARCRSAARSAPISRARCSTRRSITKPSPRRTGLIGHGGVVVFDDTVDMARQARFAMEFCAIESCGKCTPCRIGSMRGVEVIDSIVKGERRAENLALLQRALRHDEVRLAVRARRLRARSRC